MKKFIRKNTNVLFYLTIVGFSIFGIHQLTLNKTFMNTVALATTIKPEVFTELYFENHLNLPSIIKPNQPYYFEFTIHNLENQEMTYPYEVYLQAGNVKLPIDQKTVTIKNNQYKTIRVGFSVDAPIVKSEIAINLINKNQQINFWIENEMPPATKTVVKKQKSKTITPSPTPTITISLPTPTLPSTAVKTSSTSTSAITKQYGGWYVNPDENKAMVWLGKDSNNQDIWSNTLPK
jgi:hypothetical protein